MVQYWNKYCEKGREERHRWNRRNNVKYRFVKKSTTTVYCSYSKRKIEIGFTHQYTTRTWLTSSAWNLSTRFAISSLLSYRQVCLMYCCCLHRLPPLPPRRCALGMLRNMLESYFFGRLPSTPQNCWRHNNNDPVISSGGVLCTAVYNVCYNLVRRSFAVTYIATLQHNITIMSEPDLQSMQYFWANSALYITVAPLA